MRRYFVAILFCFIFTGSALAGWKKPIEVLSGTWGDKERQFGLKIEYIKVDLPVFVVNGKGEIIVGDVINKRIKVYDSAGKLIKIFGPQLDIPPSYWPTKKIGTYNNCIFVEWGKRYQSYNYDGKVESQFKLKGSRFESLMPDGTIILFDLTERIYKKYSPTGQLLETYKEKPLELGEVKERRSGSKRYKVTIKYLDKEWVVISKGACSRYVRDLNCNLYCPGHRQVIKYDEDGNEAARLTMPERIAEETPARDPGVEAIIKVIEEYGPPVVSPNGDVYAWKRTPDTYSIVKWTWQGPKDAPQSLKVASSKTGLHLTWKPPIYETKYVKEYEIVRSDEICGSFTPISTVPKNTLRYEDKDVSEGTNYCYKVSAIKASGSSEYSNKAAGKISVSQTASMEAYGNTYLKVEKDILAGKTINTTKLNSFNKNELKLLRNTIFAKYGRTFKSDMLKNWFAKKDWYNIDPNYSDSVLTDTDKKNITTFHNLEKKK